MGPGETAKIYLIYCHEGASWPAKMQRLFPDSQSWKLVPKYVSLGELSKLGTPRHHTTETYARLLLPNLLTEEKRIIYLDCDIMVRGSLADMWSHPLGEHATGMVPDIGRLRLEESLGERARDFDVDPDTRYCNAGVMLMDLDKWREQDLAGQIVRLLASQAPFPHVDQDAINIILAGRVTLLDFIYNFQIGAVPSLEERGWPNRTPEERQEILEKLPKARIVHFIGPSKPWKQGLNNPFRDEYLRVLHASGFIEQSWYSFLIQWWYKAIASSLQRKFRKR